jgi:uncharacterized protein YndB with AHSA1/START domain
MTQDANTVVVEADIAAPPETVWRAFSEPDLAADWLAPGGLNTEPGERFTLDERGRKIHCEVLESEPARRLRLAWRDDGGVASEVNFELTPTPTGGTRLRVVHGPVVLSLAMARARAQRANFRSVAVLGPSGPEARALWLRRPLAAPRAA